MSELLWMACPGGAVDGGTAMLRVLVVPRLSGPLVGGPMEDWPRTLAAAAAGLTVHARPDRRDTGVPIRHTLRGAGDSTTWRTLFGAVPVRPWQPPAAYQPGPVRRTGTTAEEIHSTYRTVARTIAATQDADSAETQTRIRQELAGWRDDRFPPGPVPDAAVPARQRDFHELVSIFREYPAVLRAAGLIIDLALEAGDIPPAGPPPADRVASWFVRVTCVGVGIDIVSPWTGYEYDARYFLPASAGGVTAGMVDLRPERSARGGRWSFTTLDGRVGATRLCDTALGLASPGVRGPHDPAPVHLPALRTIGVSLFDRDREREVAARVGRAARRSRPGGDTELGADALILGYRMDVQPSGADRWFSLCQRRATYTLDRNPIGAPGQVEEGQIKPYAAVRHGQDALVAVDEMVTRWNGWSLAVAPPRFGAWPADADPSPIDNLPFSLCHDFRTLPGSLPRLRFGRAYRVRLRVADLTGGGLTCDEMSSEYASGVVEFRRWEPVPPPEVPPPAEARDAEGNLVEGALGPAGAVDVLVIRSDPAAATTVPGEPYPPNDHRQLLPPPTTRALAEYHGVFDDRDHEWTWQLVQRAITREPFLPATAADQSYGWLPDPGASGVAVHLRAGPTGPSRPVTDWRSWGRDTWPDHPAKLLRLVAGAPAHGPGLRWPDARTAEVSLAPAQQVTVELSSTLTDADLDSFAVWQCLQESGEATAGASETVPPDTQLLVSGRHPMTTPSRLLRLVHAVRRPLRDPAGPLTARREPGGTGVRLVPPDRSPALNVDTASTVQLDLCASWCEPVDDVDRQVGMAVQSVPVTVDGDWLPELRHEFGDTRHRTVDYRLRAVSRFRRYFRQDEPDEAFVAETPVRVTVPSSARPAAPVVLATSPALRWEGDPPAPGWRRLERIRRGGLLRVELARPWYDSGAGELLAVLVWPGTPEGVPAQIRPWLTCAGRDPVWATPYPPALVPPAMVIAPTQARLSLPDSQVEVVALGYPPTFDGERWYADVNCAPLAASSYRPFVRLAVARQQPNSLPGLELSPVVTTELVQPLPDRTLVVERNGDCLTTTLHGTGPQLSPNEVQVAVERFPSTASPADPQVDLTVFDDDIVPGWVRVSREQGRLDQAITVPLPSGSDRLRLVVSESERHRRVGTPGDGTAPELHGQTVFLDVVPL